jgi:hypothetical protein
MGTLSGSIGVLNTRILHSGVHAGNKSARNQVKLLRRASGVEPVWAMVDPARTTHRESVRPVKAGTVLPDYELVADPRPHNDAGRRAAYSQSILLDSHQHRSVTLGGSGFVAAPICRRWRA